MSEVVSHERGNSVDNAAKLNLNELLQSLKSAIVDINSRAEAVQYDAQFPVETATTFARRPIAAQMSEYARTIADAMHRSSPEDVDAWNEMPYSERKLLIDGVKGLLDSGYCVVPEEVVAFARGAAQRIRELELQIEESYRPRR